MITAQLTAEPRETVGKGFNRRLRSAGRIPAVVYGDGQAAMSISIDPEALRSALKTEFKRNTIIELSVAGQGTRTVVLHDYQTHPIKHERLLHVDFRDVHLDEPEVFLVPVVITGTPIGAKKGGILEVKRREVEVRCMPRNLPVSITADVTNLDLNDSIHVADLKVPDGVSVLYQRNFTIVVLNLPKAVRKAMEEEAKAAAAEPAKA